MRVSAKSSVDPAGAIHPDHFVGEDRRVEPVEAQTSDECGRMPMAVRDRREQPFTPQECANYFEAAGYEPE